MSFISEPDYFVLSGPGSTMQDPHPTNPPVTASSVKTGSKWGQRACRSGSVKHPSLLHSYAL